MNIWKKLRGFWDGSIKKTLPQKYYTSSVNRQPQKGDGIRLHKLLAELNISLETAVDSLSRNGYDTESLGRNSLITREQCDFLRNAFIKGDKIDKASSVNKRPPKGDRVRLHKLLAELNISLETAVDSLSRNGYDTESLSRNSLITREQCDFLRNAFIKGEGIDKASSVNKQPPKGDGVRLHKLLAELNISLETAVGALSCNGYDTESLSRNSFITREQYVFLQKYYQGNVILLKNLNSINTLFNQSYVFDTNICIDAPLIIKRLSDLHLETNWLLRQIQMKEIDSPKFIISRTVLEELDRKKTDEELRMKIQKFLNINKGNKNIITPLDTIKKIPKEWSLKNADNRILNSAVACKGILVTNDKLLQTKASSINVVVLCLEDMENRINNVTIILQKAKNCI